MLRYSNPENGIDIRGCIYYLGILKQVRRVVRFGFGRYYLRPSDSIQLLSIPDVAPVVSLLDDSLV